MPRKGYKQTQDHIEKAARLRRGVPMSEVQKVLIANALRGRPQSPEHKAKVVINLVSARSKSPVGKVGNLNKHKGKTYEEIYGFEKAAELKAERRSHRGPSHWSYRDGSSYARFYRGDCWDLARAAVLERDEFTCQDCGKSPKLLDVHHIIPWRLSNSNALEILITLCRSCHATWEHEWEKYEIHAFA